MTNLLATSPQLVMNVNSCDVAGFYATYQRFLLKFPRPADDSHKIHYNEPMSNEMLYMAIVLETELRLNNVRQITMGK